MEEQKPECDSPLHNLYAPNCPRCDPKGWEKLRSKSPEGIVGEPDPTPEQDRGGAHGTGYSDTY